MADIAKVTDAFRAAIRTQRERVRGFYGLAPGSASACNCCGRARRYDRGIDEAVCIGCMEAELASMVDAFADGPPSRCHICHSPEHDSCGFCGRCREHTTFERDDDGDLASDCCGWPGYEYDHDPT